MHAFILERLSAGNWIRGGETFWSRDSAERAANRALKQKAAIRVRILQVDVDLEAVDELPRQEVGS